jgi:hypothetical protein
MRSQHRPLDKGAPMSIRVMSAVWELSLPDSEKIIALALADWCDDEGCCWPSVAQIARKASKSERTVQGVLASLEGKNILKRDQRPGKGCLYTLTPAAAAPRKDSTPAKSAPAQPLRKTPAAAAPNTSRPVISQKASPSSRARTKTDRFRMPDDWKPVRFSDDTVAREVIDRRGREWGRAALERFRNWAANADDRVGRKADWQKAWANWVIEQDERNGNRQSQRNGQGGSTSGMGRTVDAALDFVREAERGYC